MASCFALTALNLKPTQTLLPSPSSSLSPPSRRQLPAGPRVIRSAMRIYKGTQMREKRLTNMIEKKVVEAKRVCSEDDTSGECKVAWAKADLRLKLQYLHQDPIEHFCKDNSEVNECTVYEY